MKFSHQFQAFKSLKNQRVEFCNEFLAFEMLKIEIEFFHQFRPFKNLEN